MNSNINKTNQSNDLDENDEINMGVIMNKEDQTLDEEEEKNLYQPTVKFNNHIPNPPIQDYKTLNIRSEIEEEKNPDFFSPIEPTVEENYCDNNFDIPNNLYKSLMYYLSIVEKAHLEPSIYYDNYFIEIRNKIQMYLSIK
jgi:hypothetical protein